jgi:hypothetical protein
MYILVYAKQLYYSLCYSQDKLRKNEILHGTRKGLEIFTLGIAYNLFDKSIHVDLSFCIDVSFVNSIQILAMYL